MGGALSIAKRRNPSPVSRPLYYLDKKNPYVRILDLIIVSAHWGNELTGREFP